MLAFSLDWWMSVLVLALINAGLAQSKRRSGLLWFILSLILGPFATFILVVATAGDFSPAQVERDIAELKQSLARLAMGQQPKAAELKQSLARLAMGQQPKAAVPGAEETDGSITCMGCGQTISSESSQCPACGWTWITVENENA